MVFVKDSLTTSYAFSTEKPSLSSNTWKHNRKYGLFDPITSQPHDMWTTESCSPVFIQLKISFGANQSPAKLDVMASMSVSEKNGTENPFNCKQKILNEVCLRRTHQMSSVQAFGIVSELCKTPSIRKFLISQVFNSSAEITRNFPRSCYVNRYLWPFLIILQVARYSAT